MVDLDTMQRLVHYQAITKKWNKSADYCLKRAFEELDELVIAIAMNQSKKSIVLEGIDIIYFVIQVLQDAAPGVSLDKAFETKYCDNWANLKKTIDEDGNPTKR